MAGHDILVLGGGPAGCLAALRLAGMGHEVTIVTATRAPGRQGRIEGLAARAREVLDTWGCERALAAAGPEVVRRACWNGQASAHNRETLIERCAFDAGLQADVRDRGVRLISVARLRLSEGSGGWRAEARTGDGASLELAPEALVEARGRRAPGAWSKRGPGVTALSRTYLGLPQRPMTAIAAFPDGWAWFASPGDGTGCLQVFLASETLRPGKRAGLGARYAAGLAAIPEAADWLGGARPAGPLAVRAAGPVLSSAPIGATRVRIGDAAAAVDPLSGHGIFEALGSALAGSVALNTLLRRPEDAGIARRFYRERSELGFRRLAHSGRAFYALEQRWPARPFWRDRAAWPDDAPAHAAPASTAARIERRPVVEDDLVVARPVVTTADQPRGTYQVAGVALVRLLDRLSPGRDAGPGLAAALAEELGTPPAQVETALDWLAHRGLLAVTAERVAIDPGLRDERAE